MNFFSFRSWVSWALNLFYWNPVLFLSFLAIHVSQFYLWVLLIKQEIKYLTSVPQEAVVKKSLIIRNLSASGISNYSPYIECFYGAGNSLLTNQLTAFSSLLTSYRSYFESTVKKLVDNYKKGSPCIVFVSGSDAFITRGRHLNHLHFLTLFIVSIKLLCYAKLINSRVPNSTHMFLGNSWIKPSSVHPLFYYNVHFKRWVIPVIASSLSTCGIATVTSYCLLDWWCFSSFPIYFFMSQSLLLAIRRFPYFSYSFVDHLLIPITILISHITSLLIRDGADWFNLFIDNANLSLKISSFRLHVLLPSNIHPKAMTSYGAFAAVSKPRQSQPFEMGISFLIFDEYSVEIVTILSQELLLEVTLTASKDEVHAEETVVSELVFTPVFYLL